MTEVILENISHISDLIMLSKSYKKGLIKLNISKLSRELKRDRKTIERYLNGYIPSSTRKRTKYLDTYRDYIIEVSLKIKTYLSIRIF